MQTTIQEKKNLQRQGDIHFLAVITKILTKNGTTKKLFIEVTTVLFTLKSKTDS